MGRERVALATRVERILKPAGLLLLVILAALKASEFVKEAAAPWAIWVYGIIGALLVYAYLLEKMRKGRLNVKFQGGRLNVDRPEQGLYEKVFLYTLTALFVFFLIKPEFVDNVFTRAISDSIKSLYEKPVIGWVIGFIGVFFLLRMIVVGLATVSQLFSKVSKQPNEQRPSDGFDDYEIVEDVEPEGPADDQETRFLS